jgi:hypothetical protein
MRCMGEKTGMDTDVYFYWRRELGSRYGRFSGG